MGFRARNNNCSNDHLQWEDDSHQFYLCITRIPVWDTPDSSTDLPVSLPQISFESIHTAGGQIHFSPGHSYIHKLMEILLCLPCPLSHAFSLFFFYFPCTLLSKLCFYSFLFFFPLSLPLVWYSLLFFFFLFVEAGEQKQSESPCPSLFSCCLLWILYIGLGV